jgi:hypothetical protein
MRGKGNRHERLPLPADVGQAVVSYLEAGHLWPPTAQPGLRPSSIRVWRDYEGSNLRIHTSQALNGVCPVQGYVATTMNRMYPG